VYYVLVASRHYKHHQPVKEIKEEGRQLQPERKKEHDRISGLSIIKIDL
jgi:hypothetical protein